VTQIEDLKKVIHKLHGGKAAHRQSVHVHGVFHGKTVWGGIVEVFHLEGHPMTDSVYAWMHDRGEGQQPRQVTVLHVHPALSAAAAVRAFIVQEFRANAAEA
jgi:hypothetical protein